MRFQQPRSDTMPITWEMPAAVLGTWLLLAVAALPGAQGAATWVTSGTFVWPHGQLLQSLGGLLRGHAGVGLTRADRTHLAAAPLIWISVAVLELLLLAAATWVFAWTWRTWSPAAQVGLAPPHEAAAVLGLGNLRSRRAVIRPDLYRRPRRLHIQTTRQRRARTAR